MAEIKTKPTAVSVDKFIKSVPDKQKREDSYVLIDMMKKITKEEPEMWGPSIIGFGTYHYKYASGHEGDMPLAGFSPRKAAISVYLSCDLPQNTALLKKLGKHKVTKSCLYIKRLSDVDIKVLNDLIVESYKDTKNKKW